jgi:putative ABC transport system permease protein
VISDRFWLRRFAGDDKIIGRKIQLDGATVTIVGVMPPGFDHPLLWGNIDAWLPISFTTEQKQNRNSNYLRSFARLKPGVSIGQAQQAMVTLQAGMAKEFSLAANESIRLEPFGQAMSDEIGRR